LVPILVTTEHRGVFFGRVPEFPESIPPEVELAGARMCLYWSTAEHGVFGLAVSGPGEGCRVGPAVPRLRLNGITSIALCTFAAAARWEAQPWRE